MLTNHFSIEITIITIIPYVLYIPKVHNHVGLVRNINNATVNNTKNPCKIRLYEDFYNSKKCVTFIKKAL